MWAGSPGLGRERAGSEGLSKRLSRLLKSEIRVSHRPVCRFSYFRIRFPCATATNLAKFLLLGCFRRIRLRSLSNISEAFLVIFRRGGPAVRPAVRVPTEVRADDLLCSSASSTSRRRRETARRERQRPCSCQSRTRRLQRSSAPRENDSLC